MRQPWLALGLGLFAQAATVAYVLEPRTIVRIEHTADVIAMPVPVVVETIVQVPRERVACPPPRRDVPRVTPARVPEAIAHVRPSPTNAGWIAAWNDQHIYISIDAGASWQRALDGAGPVQDVAFDCFGRVLALRDTKVGMRDGAEQWRAIPTLHAPDAQHPQARLLGGGPDIVVIGHGSDEAVEAAQLAVSHDRGVTWRGARLGAYWEGGEIHGRQHEDGTVRAMVPIADCMSESAYTFRWRDGVRELIDTVISSDLGFFGDRMVSSSGWQTIGHDTSEAMPALDYAYPAVIEGGPQPILHATDGLYRLDGTRLPWKLGGDEEDLVADPAGRIWSSLCGQPHVVTRVMPPACRQLALPQGAGDSR